MSDSIPNLLIYFILAGALVAYFIFRKKESASGLSEEMADVQNAAADGFGASEQIFPPSKEFVAKARVKGMDGYKKLYKESIDNPEKFWADEAKELTWFEPWTKVLDESKKPFFKWFVNGKTNISYNCIDAQIKKGLGDKVAIVFEGEPTQNGTATEVRRITYKELLVEVSRFANVLKELGLKKGDTVAIYMPMVPELAFAVLACARIGVVHSVVFGGFPQSLFVIVSTMLNPKPSLQWMEVIAAENS
jgi:hypothetical protein